MICQPLGQVSGGVIRPNIKLCKYNALILLDVYELAAVLVGTLKVIKLRMAAELPGFF